MFRKFMPLALMIALLTVSSNIGVFAASTTPDDAPAASSLKAAIDSKTAETGPTVSSKSTLADYERERRKGKGFSTTTKILIGVGIAAAAVGIFVFAASRDKIEPFRR